MSTTDAFLPFDEPDDRADAPDEYEDELDVEEGLDLDDAADDDAADDDDDDLDLSDVDTSFRAPTPGSRLTAEELEADLEDDA